ncbi:MAG: 3-oxoadipate enol-lactonase [Salinarimonadaceae bacterium]|nr:MAG: 3-oxoadipate enol-lactonase [Salinarimonadaceae bacterium]
MATIKIDGIDFEVVVEGPPNAPALLLSNSLSSNLHMWDAQASAFAQRFRVVRYDQRGHGRTAAPEGPYSIARLAQDAVEILDALGIARAHFCGISMGGMTGMRLLTHHRSRIDRTVLANTAAHMGPPDLWNARIAAARKGGMEAVADATVARWFTQSFRERAPDRVERVRAMILATPVAGYAACCGAIRDMDQRHAIRAIDAPVLVILGAHDPATTPVAGEAIHAAIRGSSIVSLDAAHLSNIEKPEAFNEAVLDFLR